MPSLLDVAAEFEALSALLDESGGEITSENEAFFDELFKEFAGNEAVKVDGYCNLIQRLESEGVVAKARKENFAKLQKTRENAVENLRDRLKQYGLTTERLTCSVEVEGSKKKAPGRKIETTGGWVVSVQPAGGTQAIIIDETYPEVEEEFLIYAPPTIDKKKVREALDAGRKLPFASLAERGINLIIK